MTPPSVRPGPFARKRRGRLTAGRARPVTVAWPGQKQAWPMFRSPGASTPTRMPSPRQLASEATQGSRAAEDTTGKNDDSDGINRESYFQKSVNNLIYISMLSAIRRNNL